MTEIELKACPFCGKPPRTCPDTSYGEALVFCPDDNECDVAPSASADLYGGETLAQAIAAWNTRPEPPLHGYAEGVEAAARVAETLFAEPGWNGHYVGAASKIAAAIRALTPKEPQP